MKSTVCNAGQTWSARIYSSPYKFPLRTQLRLNATFSFVGWWSPPRRVTSPGTVPCGSGRCLFLRSPFFSFPGWSDSLPRLQLLLRSPHLQILLQAPLWPVLCTPSLLGASSNPGTLTLHCENPRSPGSSPLLSPGDGQSHLTLSGPINYRAPLVEEVFKEQVWIHGSGARTRTQMWSSAPEPQSASLAFSGTSGILRQLWVYLWRG